MSASIELEKTYSPTTVEPEIYKRWQESGACKAIPDNRPPEERYVIMLPLPNVTGALHLGHAINNSLQDIMTRWSRMHGKNTLWQPGTDHAGIATQAVVEKRLFQEENLTRHDLGREKLVERIWEWKEEYQKRILSQLKEMGASCDWDRTRFTLDEICSKAVRHAFFIWFRDGLVFRGKRLVNWDTHLQTAVADDEIFYEKIKSHFWHIKYPVIDPKPGEPTHVTIATTRPETMLADTAVAVHPDPEKELNHREEKYRTLLEKANEKEKAELEEKLEAIAERRASHLEHLKQLSAMAADGRKLRLPLVDREIPLVHDNHADPEKGSGCVKITPAHDPNDYDVARRCDLPGINVLTADGLIAEIIELDGTKNPNSDKYAGLKFSTDGRKKVVEDLEELELLVEVVDHQMEVGHSDRSKTPIEPYLSDQWFVKMSDIDGGITLGDGSKSPGLAQAAMDAVTSDRLQIFPKRYTKTYLDWLSEKRDWCISRQLWWGHRIPVWSLQGDMPAGKEEEVLARLRAGIERGTVAYQPFDVDGDDNFNGNYCLLPEAEEELGEYLLEHGFVQEDDVLDTWFSSQLWPFSTLGWPEKTESLDYYYPGSVLITSRDIITLWVARMTLSGLYFMGDVPFAHTYIHTKILDGRGDGMSKSKGNGVDPIDIIHSYGADALRYTMAEIATELQDVRMPVDYKCPYCGGLTPQTAVVPHNKKPCDIFKVKCKECKKEFATQWANKELKEQFEIARETSERFEGGRNLCNKIWNAARFAFMNLEGVEYKKIDRSELFPEDRWILAELTSLTREVNDLLSRYQFSASVKMLREFFWDSLCDWYVELTKPRMAKDAAPEKRGDVARQVLAFVLDQTLRLFSPYIPYITERLWESLNALAPKRGLPGLAEPAESELLINAQYPPMEGWTELEDIEIISVFADLQDAVRGVRDLRSKCGIPPKEQVTVTLRVPEDRIISLMQEKHVIEEMAGADHLEIVSEFKRPKNAATTLVGEIQIFVHDISDDDAELKRVTKELENVEKQIKGKESKLNNEKFVNNAKAEVVEAERERLEALLEQRTALQQAKSDLTE